ncbi:MAG: HAD-IA family hydrolase [Clostridiales Family XIII bacterium]|jgi:pyrophosphatase PpaX|nr:HAD-IA family hydrolase [Clostridiales Family XIII bacterium]
MRNIDSVLFDFDGTIMDTNDAVLSSWQHVYRTLEGQERPAEEIYATFGEPIEVTVANKFPGRDADEVIAVYRSYHVAHYEEMVRLFPGVMEMLDSLKADGYKMGVVTNRLRRTTVLGLEKYHIEGYFGSVICAGDAAKNKPAPDPALKALAQLGSHPGAAIFVGDSQHDILCGKNAGIRTVRVSWAVATDADHGDAAAEPDHTIDRPSDLTGLLRDLNARIRGR